ncbi:MAG: ASKHA domain-containing protein, partial [Lachnospiraceae bacterium]
MVINMSMKYEGQTIKIEVDGEILKLQQGESIFAMLQRQEKLSLAFCGGRGICGRCRIRFLENPTMPAAMDRTFFTPEELRTGMRLACLSKPKSDCRVQLCFPIQTDREVVTDCRLSAPKATGDGSALIAIDLGTTTIAMQCLSILEGTILGEYCAMNPQRQYGADVVSRMDASNAGHGISLQRLVKEELRKGITSLTLDKNMPIILAGNTVMEHLLLGYDVHGLSQYPFQPIDITQKILELDGYHIVIMPCISAFVGADITAGLLAVQIQETDKTNLFLDLGTNGEMAIANRKHILCTASAAGPAFEGGITAQIPGTDMIALTAQLLEQGIIDASGLMKEPYFTHGYDRYGILIRQSDIRDLQMAKAAVAAGISMLMKQWNVSFGEIDRVYLAGGFGYYLDVRYAKEIGLVPAELADKVVAVGNTSLYGAY